MGGAGPLTSQQVAARARVSGRYAHEWLRTQAPGILEARP